MEILISVEADPERGYVARDAFGFSSFGNTADEATANLKVELQARLSNGSLRFLKINLPNKTVETPHPYLAMSGTLKDSPFNDEWEAAIAENRLHSNIKDAAEWMVQDLVEHINSLESSASA